MKLKNKTFISLQVNSMLQHTPYLTSVLVIAYFFPKHFKYYTLYKEVVTANRLKYLRYFIEIYFL